MRKLIVALSALFTALFLHDAFAQTGGGFPPAALPIVVKCTTSCALPAAGIKVGQAAVIVTTAGESRTSTTTPTFSTNLVWTGCGSCGSQTYVWYIQGQWANSGGAQGIKITMGSSLCNTGFGYASFGTLSGGGSFVTPFDLTPANALQSTNTGGSIFISGISGGSGLPGLCFSQNVSGATATFLNTGMMYLIQRVQ